MEKLINEIKESNLSDKLKVISIANLFLGQDEVKGNKGFDSAYMEEKMKSVGWQEGWAWCASFVEMVYKLAVDRDDLRPLFTPGCTRTLRNFKKAGFDVSMVPEAGSVMIMQRDGSWQGHAGIVHHVEDDIVFTVEGNTNDRGGREGYTVSMKERKYKDTSRSMDVVGFIKVF